LTGNSWTFIRAFLCLCTSP